MHISVFFSDGMYSVLSVLYNYLQFNNQITLFMKKKKKNIDVKIVLKILIQNFFKTTLQLDLKSYMIKKITLYPLHCLISMYQIRNLYDTY